MALTKRHNYFPFDLFEFCEFPGQLGSDIRMLSHYSMFPPFPWGQWLYGRLIEENIKQIEGDFIDLGVGLGGMSLFLGLRAREHQRKMYCLDSFTGMTGQFTPYRFLLPIKSCRPSQGLSEWDPAASSRCPLQSRPDERFLLD